MSQTEQNQNTEDGCALSGSRETASDHKNSKRKAETDVSEHSKRAKENDQSISQQNGGCRSDIGSFAERSIAVSGSAEFFGAENQEVIESKFFTHDEHPLLDSASSILKNIEKDGDIDDMCAFSPTGALALSTSPTKSGDINDILASFNDNIPLSCAGGLVSSSSSSSGLSTLTLTSSKVTNDGNVLLTTTSRSRLESSAQTLNGSGMPLTSEDLAHFAEMTKESNLISDNAELLNAERSIVENDSGLDFRIVEPDRSNTLMTPQEIERMPDQGLEFEASVGPKDKDVLSGTDIDESLDIAGSAKSLGDTSLSLGSDQGTTQFIVNTEDGKQQVLNLKMSDVYQVVHLVGSPTVQNISLPPGFAIQDGFLVLPVTCASGNVDDSNEDSNSGTPDSMLSQGFTVQQISQHDGKLIDMPSTASGKLYCCMEEHCGRLFDKQSKLRIHMMSHTGVRPFKCEVEGCQWAFRTNFQLKRHRLSHEKRKDFMCDYPGCNRLFSTIYNLTAHKRLHDRPLNFSCTVCDEKFDTQRKLDVHHKTHENAKRQYKCPYPGCDRVFFSANCMGSHTRWHEQSIDLRCHYPGCGRVFSKLCRLKIHLRMHTGDKPFVCKVCNAAFTTNSKLVRHEGIHTGLRPFACQVEGCGKRFPRQEHLTGHMNTHTGEKPFMCPYTGCGAKFSAKSSMHVHYKKHVDGTMGGKKSKMRFPCPLDGCKKIYTTKASLRAHLMKHCGDFPSGGDREHAELDIVAMLAASADFVSPSADELSQSAPDTATTGAATLSTADVAMINPADYLIKDQQTVQPASFPSEVITHHVGNNVVTQLVVSDLTQALTTISGPSVASEPTTSFSVASDVASTSSVPTVAKEQEEGSARTDFTCNQILSVRAKNRRQLLKQRLSVGFNFDEKNTDADSKKKEPIMSGPTLNPHELLTSRAITFRDPETGTTYVQTQLLQDDPPNPEIYTEEEHGSLGNVALSVEGDNAALNDAGNVVDFTGTTINLQDLA